MPTPNRMVVCERCGFVALLRETSGWEMRTLQKGLCPACVKDSVSNGDPPKPQTKAAH
jgi:hypothetical protein